MPKYEDKQFETIEDGKNWWRTTTLGQLSQSMGINMPNRLQWIRNATEIVEPGSSVYDVGCGTGILSATLPPGCTVYGNDLNATYIAKAQADFGDENHTYVLEDFYEHFNSGRKYDYVILTSIFGFFPEEESYRLIPRFWDMAKKGMAITTLNKDKYPGKGRRTHNLTSHDPREMEANLRALPGVSEVKMFTNIPIERRNIRRGMYMHVFRGE